MWVKICGISEAEDAQTAVEAGADAIGFIFAPSPRQVGVGKARRIAAALPAAAERFGVFVDSGVEEIAAAVEECGLSGVQLHAPADPALPFRLRERLERHHPAVAMVSVLRCAVGEGAGEDEADLDLDLEGFARRSGADAVLVDSFSPRAAGGTGRRFDWRRARRSFLRAGPSVRLIAAGGLSPENVAQAIQTLQPWGVDVVSGVERAPGTKDPARIVAFLRAAKAAGEAVGSDARSLRIGLWESGSEEPEMRKRG